VGLRDDGDFAEISVTDSGAGIPTELRERIMQPFFTSRPVGQGQGLGLSLTRGIVEQHGGALRLDTASPHTRFVMRLPKHRPRAPGN
jgi:signal transduction histidine kinase